MIHLKKLKSPFILILLVGILTSCGQNKAKNKKHDKVKVLSSFSIVSNIIREIGQDQVDVYNLVPIGMAPHNYAPKPSDVKFATEADLAIYNGLNLEGGQAGWFMKLTNSVHIDSDKIFSATKGLSPMYIDDERGRKEINPHAFISPKVGILMATNIENALIAVDKKHQAYYEKNTESYIKQLQDLDKEYRQKIGEIPKKDRVFMASEQAFQYLVHEYGLKEGYIWAIDTDKNGTPDQIKRAISFINTNKPPILFIESNVDRRPMETISKATGIKIYKNPIYSDELGKPGQKADTYLKYLQYNLKQIYNGLAQN